MTPLQHNANQLTAFHPSFLIPLLAVHVMKCLRMLAYANAILVFQQVNTVLQKHFTIHFSLLAVITQQDFFLMK